MNDRSIDGGGDTVMVQAVLRRALPALAIACWATASICTPAAHAQVITEDIKLLASDGEESDFFGNPVAVDAGIVAVGASSDDDNGSSSGSAYLFDAVTGTELFKLVPVDGASLDSFGSSIAIENGIVVIGAIRADDNGGASTGAAYIYDVATGLQIRKLLATGAESGDHVGETIAMENGIIAVGAPNTDDVGLLSGAAYLFDAASGAQLFKLLPNDGVEFDFFGQSIAIDNGVVAVGAPMSDTNGADAGAVYLFNATTGAQLFKLVPDDGETNEQFGTSVSISGGIIAIGTPWDDDNGPLSGSVYLYDVTTGTQVSKILSDEGDIGHSFGRSVDLEGDLLTIGASGNNSAFLYDAPTTTQLLKLLPSDGELFDVFGISVALNGSTIVIGAWGDSDNGSNSGSAYIFDGTIEQHCLGLAVNNLEAGKKARIIITNGTPNARAVTVYGTKAGQTVVNNISGYCATFGIKGVSQDKVIGGLNKIFDAEGTIGFNQLIPGNTAGLAVLFQAAERGTCPDECMSNIWEGVIE